MAKRLIGVGEFSRQVAYGAMPEVFQPKEPKWDYKDPGNMRVAEAWRTELQGRRSAVRQRMKLLEQRWLGSNGSMAKVEYDKENGLVRGMMSRVGMYLRWIKDWIKVHKTGKGHKAKALPLAA